jgi:hypothetical protein
MRAGDTETAKKLTSAWSAVGHRRNPRINIKSGFGLQVIEVTSALPALRRALK